MDKLDPYLQKSFDDIVFENRNKQYGSYYLRSITRQNTFRGLSFTTYLVGFALFFYYIDFDFFNKETPPLVLYETEVTLSDPPPILETMPPAVPPTEQIVATEELAELVVQEDDKVIEKTETTESTPSDSTTTGTKTDGNNPNSNVTGNGKTVYLSTEVKPEYPGGTKGLNRYLSDNLKYPDVARDNGITGIVTVSFIINEDGSVSNAKVERSIGGGCDQEALRIVSEMRKWKPAKQGGVPVAVYMKLPIVFQLQDN